MGNRAHTVFSQIEKKYGLPAADYIAHKANQRSVHEQTKDQVQRILEHASLKEREDLEWINQERRSLERTLDEAKTQADTHKKGLVQEAEAKHKKSVNQFSGYNAELKRLEDLEKQVRDKYRAERARVQGKVDAQIKKIPNNSTLREINEFDTKSDSQRKSIEEQCAKKYPAKVSKFTSVELERSLNWESFKVDFEAILNRSQVGRENEQGRTRVKSNVVPTGAPICC